MGENLTGLNYEKETLRRSSINGDRKKQPRSIDRAKSTLGKDPVTRINCVIEEAQPELRFAKSQESCPSKEKNKTPEILDDWKHRDVNLENGIENPSGDLYPHSENGKEAKAIQIFERIKSKNSLNNEARQLGAEDHGKTFNEILNNVSASEKNADIIELENDVGDVTKKSPAVLAKVAYNVEKDNTQGKNKNAPVYRASSIESITHEVANVGLSSFSNEISLLSIVVENGTKKLNIQEEYKKRGANESNKGDVNCVKRYESVHYEAQNESLHREFLTGDELMEDEQHFEITNIQNECEIRKNCRINYTPATLTAGSEDLTKPDIHAECKTQNQMSLNSLAMILRNERQGEENRVPVEATSKLMKATKGVEKTREWELIKSYSQSGTNEAVRKGNKSRKYDASKHTSTHLAKIVNVQTHSRARLEDETMYEDLGTGRECAYEKECCGSTFDVSEDSERPPKFVTRRNNKRLIDCPVVREENKLHHMLQGGMIGLVEGHCSARLKENWKQSVTQEKSDNTLKNVVCNDQSTIDKDENFIYHPTKGVSIVLTNEVEESEKNSVTRQFEQAESIEKNEIKEEFKGAVNSREEATVMAISTNMTKESEIHGDRRKNVEKTPNRANHFKNTPLKERRGGSGGVYREDQTVSTRSIRERVKISPQGDNEGHIDLVNGSEIYSRKEREGSARNGLLKENLSNTFGTTEVTPDSSNCRGNQELIQNGVTPAETLVSKNCEGGVVGVIETTQDSAEELTKMDTSHSNMTFIEVGEINTEKRSLKDCERGMNDVIKAGQATNQGEGDTFIENDEMKKRIKKTDESNASSTIVNKQLILMELTELTKSGSEGEGGGLSNGFSTTGKDFLQKVFQDARDYGMEEASAILQEAATRPSTPNPHLRNGNQAENVNLDTNTTRKDPEGFMRTTAGEAQQTTTETVGRLPILGSRGANEELTKCAIISNDNATKKECDDVVGRVSEGASLVSKVEVEEPPKPPARRRSQRLSRNASAKGDKSTKKDFKVEVEEPQKPPARKSQSYFKMNAAIGDKSTKKDFDNFRGCSVEETVTPLAKSVKEYSKPEPRRRSKRHSQRAATRAEKVTKKEYDNDVHCAEKDTQAKLMHEENDHIKRNFFQRDNDDADKLAALGTEKTISENLDHHEERISKENNLLSSIEKTMDLSILDSAEVNRRQTKYAHSDGSNSMKRQLRSCKDSLTENLSSVEPKRAKEARRIDVTRIKTQLSTEEITSGVRKPFIENFEYATECSSSHVAEQLRKEKGRTPQQKHLEAKIFEKSEKAIHGEKTHRKQNIDTGNDNVTGDAKNEKLLSVDEKFRRPTRKVAISARMAIKQNFNVSTSSSRERGLTGTQEEADVEEKAERKKKVSINSRQLQINPFLSSLRSSPTNAGKYYEEESSWRFHNPAFPHDSVKDGDQLTLFHERENIPHMVSPTPSEDLSPLPPAPPLPKLPSTGFCKWTFDSESRVLLANFQEPSVLCKTNGKIHITAEDEIFLLKMMERDDVTLISEGLANDINPSLWTKEYIEGCIGREYYHKIRGFRRTIEVVDKESKKKRKKEAKKYVERYEEMNGWFNMKVSDYFRYLAMHTRIRFANNEDGANRHDLGPHPGNTDDDCGLKNKTIGEDKSSNIFTFNDSDDNEVSINVLDVVLYMVDVDMVKLLPRAFDDFQHNFKLFNTLPGGSHCMMNSVNINGRPFMGPNLYITPPSSFTNFHQDGHGTVDSGHLCLSGYNEVVMLRRLTERHKCHALHLLNEELVSPRSTLYGLPHRDGLELPLVWPTNDAIRSCADMRYYPSVFILKPGQTVHINKGRLHAFRKLSPTALPETDCHFSLRKNVMPAAARNGHLCFSIAWDWMFKGVTSEGINREVSSILECARLNRRHLLQSLAIPETALLCLAKENVAKQLLKTAVGNSRVNSLIQLPLKRSRHELGSSSFVPDTMTVLSGILPSLQYIVHRHSLAVKSANLWKKGNNNKMRVSIHSKPNAWENPESFALDPYGNGDFFCKICMEELSNVYMHCDGCEKILNKDFNICTSCHAEGRYKIKYQMHPINPKRHSTINHTGSFQRDNKKRCPCRNGPVCLNCSFCAGCSCKCHQWFTLHYRFMREENELELLQQVESIVGSNIAKLSQETKARLFSMISLSPPSMATEEAASASFSAPISPISGNDLLGEDEDKKSTPKVIGQNIDSFRVRLTGTKINSASQNEVVDSVQDFSVSTDVNPFLKSKYQISSLSSLGQEANVRCVLNANDQFPPLACPKNKSPEQLSKNIIEQKDGDAPKQLIKKIIEKNFTILHQLSEEIVEKTSPDERTQRSPIVTDGTPERLHEEIIVREFPRESTQLCPVTDAKAPKHSKGTQLCPVIDVQASERLIEEIKERRASGEDSQQRSVVDAGAPERLSRVIIERKSPDKGSQIYPTADAETPEHLSKGVTESKSPDESAQLCPVTDAEAPEQLSKGIIEKRPLGIAAQLCPVVDAKAPEHLNREIIQSKSLDEGTQLCRVAVAEAPEQQGREVIKGKSLGVSAQLCPVVDTEAAGQLSKDIIEQTSPDEGAQIYPVVVDEALENVIKEITEQRHSGEDTQPCSVADAKAPELLNREMIKAKPPRQDTQLYLVTDAKMPRNFRREMIESKSADEGSQLCPVADEEAPEHSNKEIIEKKFPNKGPQLCPIADACLHKSLDEDAHRADAASILESTLTWNCRVCSKVNWIKNDQCFSCAAWKVSSTLQRNHKGRNTALISESSASKEKSEFFAVDWQKRCPSLVEDSPDPVVPCSKYDLSPPAIAYTAPLGQIRHDKNGGRVGNMARQDLIEFVMKARSLDSLTEKDLVSLLPPNSGIEFSAVRHLYRNFADAKDIDGPVVRPNISFVTLSRREIDIINYSILNGKGFQEAMILIPYRHKNNVKDFYKQFKDHRKELRCTDYGRVVKHSVGKLQQLEGETG